MVNVAVIAGNLTKDVELRRSQSGMAVANMSVAVNERKKNSQTGEWEDVANYFDVVAFGERWEKLAIYLAKGTKVTVKGSLRQSRWTTKEGQNRSKVEIVADDIEFMSQKQGGNAKKKASAPEYVEASVYDSEIPF